MVASTGVIGQILPIDTFETAVPAAYEALSAHGGADAARAIMTTDTHSKEYAVYYRSEAAGHAGNAYTVGGMCKGSGMIMPNMATMIAGPRRAGGAPCPVALHRQTDLQQGNGRFRHLD